jgi:hypothetical protein
VTLIVDETGMPSKASLPSIARTSRPSRNDARSPSGSAYASAQP